MREIKFRAWDGTRMYHFENHEWTLDFNDISGWNVVKNLPLEQLKGRKWDAGESSDTAEQFQLMQYTGLKDKNGKEIYEGDIVHCLHPATQTFVPYGKVSFQNGCFKFDYINDPWNLFTAKEIEVVGNVYENPELTIVSLEQTQPPKTEAQEP